MVSSPVWVLYLDSVPQMLVLFIFLAFLESCGYMSRIAFIIIVFSVNSDYPEKSFIPMLIGSGCGVPGVMASRTIENDRDRKMTIMTTTFVPCGAKLPIIALIAGAFFHNSGWVAWSAYFVGVAAIICSGIILKKTKMFAGEPAPFVMELPCISLANRWKRTPQHVGAWMVFHQESRYNYPVINNCFMVLNELRMEQRNLWNA